MGREEENILGTDGIGHLLLIFAVPGIVSMVVNSIYNIVDQIFIGKGVGTLGNGATNVIFPLTTLALAFAMMIGNGAGAYMSLMLGRKEEKEAARGTAAGMAGIIVTGILLAVIYELALEPLCVLFGATENILPYALDYGRIICLGIPFCSISAGYSSVIRSDGAATYNMAGLLTGCIINIILDPIFIFICGWGVKGAAYATIIGQAANALISLLYIRRFRTIQLTKETFAGCSSAFPKVCNLGLSSFISQMVVVIAMAVQNNVLVAYGATSKYGEDIPMTALGVTMKIFNILMAIVMGLAAGASPIWGYNYGAQKFDRVKTTFKYVLGIGIAVMSVAFVLFHIFPVQIISIFGNDSPLYQEFSVKCLQIFLMMIPLGAVQMVSCNFFQAMGKPGQASLISLSKQIIFQIPMSLILPAFIGVEGVLWSGAFSDVCACVLSLILLRLNWQKIFTPIEEPEADPVNYDFETGLGYLGDGQMAGPHAPNVIITLGRSYGSPGKAIGRLLAEKLELPYYDGEILQQASENCGLNKHYMQHVNENMRSYRLVYSLVPLRDPNVFGMDDLRRIADEAQSEIILRAAQGPCVIVGRRADQILRDRKNLFRVFITMGEDQRVERIARREKMTEEEARKTVHTIDRNRMNYYGDLGGRVWGHADNYDLCLNVGEYDEETAVNLILKAMEDRKGPQKHE